MMQLRDYQEKLKADIYAAWQSHRNVLAALATGGGKTAVFSKILEETNGMPAIAIAHRQELVSQISLTLAGYGVMHRIIAPKNVVRWISRLHTEELGTQFYNPQAPIVVAGVDTLVRKQEELKRWGRSVQIKICDEGHHLLAGNKWGKAFDMFPNAWGLGVTATPCRGDNKGLGRHADGVYDTLIEGPPMRELINRGFLTEYRIFAPPSDISQERQAGSIEGVNVSAATGDYNATQLRQRMRRSRVTGDVVTHYLRLTNGKQGVTFVTDVESAVELKEKFCAAGVRAEVLTAKTDDRVRVETIRRFRRRQIQQIVNVDILGEGFDVPGIEVISFARPTESYNLYAQQFGRSLRPLDGKTHAIIIDHVGNVRRHGLPDAPRVWTLDGRERRSRQEYDPDNPPLKTCAGCLLSFRPYLKACPECGLEVEVGNRARPEFVDGDLTELDPETLRQMRGEVERIDAPADSIRTRLAHAGLNGPAIQGAMNRHRERREAQQQLRDAIALWAGWQRYLDKPDHESYKRFFYTFNVDVLTAQTLGRPEAEQLLMKVNEDIARLSNGN